MIKVDEELIDEMWGLHTRTAEKMDMDLASMEDKDTFIFGAMHTCAFLREGAMRQKDIDFKMLNSMCDIFASHLIEKGVMK